MIDQPFECKKSPRGVEILRYKKKDHERPGILDARVITLLPPRRPLIGLNIQIVS